MVENHLEEKSFKRNVAYKQRVGSILKGEQNFEGERLRNVLIGGRAYNNSFGEYPLRFTIYDNSEARITLGKPEISDPKDYITIWTKSKPLINILRSQFMNMWKNCKPIEKCLH